MEAASPSRLPPQQLSSLSWAESEGDLGEGVIQLLCPLAADSFPWKGAPEVEEAVQMPRLLAEDSIHLEGVLEVDQPPCLQAVDSAPWTEVHVVEEVSQPQRLWVVEAIQLPRQWVVEAIQLLPLWVVEAIQPPPLWVVEAIQPPRLWVVEADPPPRLLVVEAIQPLCSLVVDSAPWKVVQEVVEATEPLEQQKMQAVLMLLPAKLMSLKMDQGVEEAGQHVQMLEWAQSPSLMAGLEVKEAEVVAWACQGSSMN